MVDHLNLSVPAGQIVGILGPNGAGKTTTIKLISGRIVPTAGHVRLHGYDIVHERSAARQQLGAVFEDAVPLALGRTVWEYLLPEGQGLREREQRAAELLADLGLSERRGDAVRELSRSMRRGLLFARLLLEPPAAVVLDEPTLGFDRVAQRVIGGWVRQLAHTYGAAVLLATHSPMLARELCDRVAVLSNGRLIASHLPSAADDLYDGGDAQAAHQYSIRVKGHLSDRWAAWFDGLTITNIENGETLLSGMIPDQAALHGLIIRVRDLGLPLLSITRNQPDIEELYARLLRANAV